MQIANRLDGRALTGGVPVAAAPTAPLCPMADCTATAASAPGSIVPPSPAVAHRSMNSRLSIMRFTVSRVCVKSRSLRFAAG